MTSSITSYAQLEEFGRTRLSPNFFMREFLQSEIATWHGMRNVPENPERAVWAGQQLCNHLLEPLQATFGRIHVRSGYRSPEVNAFGNQHKLNCASNEKNYGSHIWDYPAVEGHYQAAEILPLPTSVLLGPRAFLAPAFRILKLSAPGRPFCLSQPVFSPFSPHICPCRRICPRLRSRVRL